MKKLSLLVKLLLPKQKDSLLDKIIHQKTPWRMNWIGAFILSHSSLTYGPTYGEIQEWSFKGYTVNGRPNCSK